MSPGSRPKIAIDAAAIALYECRSLERLLACHAVAFDSSTKEGTPGPSPEEQQRVKVIVAEADHPSYFASGITKSGNRERHYRGPAAGATIMHSLLLTPLRGARPRAALRERGTEELDDRQRLVAAIGEFRRRVDAAVPGVYSWFDDRSLHITLRALIV